MFGEDVSISIDTALIGARWDGDNGPQSGSAYVLALLPDIGDPCSLPAECASGWCADGVCCDKECRGLCQTCLAAKKGGGMDGTCGPIAAGTDPDDECFDDFPECGQNGLCDGAGECRLWADGTEYVAQSCADATSINEADTCDGLGQCVDNGTTACLTGYACVSGACQTTCTVDGDCAAAWYCSGGVCVPDDAIGVACTDDGHCTSGHCADSVCCDEACNGICEGCTQSRTGVADGTCTPVLAGTDPDNECAQSVGYPGDCGADGACDGAGNCRGYALAGVVCGPAVCNGNSVEGHLCDGQGICEPSATQDCAPGRCVTDSCVYDCASDADCDPSGFCDSGDQCVAQLGPGEDCDRARQCASDHCADGVCCNTACAGPCEACAESGTEGTCTPVTGTPRPGHDPCPVAPATDPCSQRLCNGQNALTCAGFVGAEIVCVEAGCNGEMRVPESRCDGAGSCTVIAEVSCAPGRCEDAACTDDCSTSSDCAAGTFCDAGTCMTQYSNGEACAQSNECASDHCVDGYCCNDACGEQCEACDVPGAEGTCAPVQGQPHGARPACPAGTTEDPCSEAQCDGNVHDACAAYVGSNVVCAAPSCSDGIATPEGRCDGAGHCVSGEPVDCGAYECGDAACLTSCTSDDDCAGLNTCNIDTGDCVAAARCGDDGVSIQNPDGTTDTCSPYACTSGRCLTTCDSAADCAPDHRCTADGTCVPRTEEASASDEEGGCGCRAASSSRTSDLAGLGLLLALGLLGSRRRCLDGWWQSPDHWPPQA